MQRFQYELHPEVAQAQRDGQPVVALESTLITHGLPWPVNLETAREAEAAVRAAGAVPATIAVLDGQPTIGLDANQLEGLARNRDVLKASRRDLALAIVQGRTAATTVASTLYLAHRAGIRVFATGGIGGVHRGASQTWDISADLGDLARFPVAVVCAGAKSILDLPATLEWLETAGVPVLGFETDTFPAFYVRSSGERVLARLDEPRQIAALLQMHWQLDGAGVVVAQPIAADVALSDQEFAAAFTDAERQAAAAGIRGKEVTPYLLARIAEFTGGRSLPANRALIVANARLAARIAAGLTG